MSTLGSVCQMAGFALSLFAVWKLGGPWPFVLVGGISLAIIGVALEQTNR